MDLHTGEARSQSSAGIAPSAAKNHSSAAAERLMRNAGPVRRRHTPADEVVLKGPTLGGHWKLLSVRFALGGNRLTPPIERLLDIWLHRGGRCKPKFSGR